MRPDRLEAKVAVVTGTVEWERHVNRKTVARQNPLKKTSNLPAKCQGVGERSTQP